MPFYSAVNDAIGRVNSASSQLYRYNNYAHPRSEPNNSIRNQARVTLNPAFYNLQNEARNAYWEGVPRRGVNDALRAAEAIRRATFDLSDKSASTGRPPDINLAQRHLQDAIGFLNRVRW